MLPFPTYVITSFPINEIQLRSGKMINKNKYVVVIQEEDSHIESENRSNVQMETENNDVVRETREPLEPKEPPFPEILIVKKTK